MATYRIPGLTLTEHVLEVPLDHDDPGGAQIEVFAREVASVDARGGLPHLVFLQGGPGHEATRPSGGGPAWLTRALKEYRVVLIDQRGTGRSTPVGSLPGMTPAEQADYLAHFRADAIVRDCEALRRALGIDRWSVLGQSFGGFCVTSYLSLAPEGLVEAFITGGLPGLGNVADAVFERTYALVAERSRRYYDRYPEDRVRVCSLHERLAAGEEILLPSGDRLTSERVRTLGHPLGMSDGAEQLHHLLELDPLSPAFLHDAEAGGFARNPLYLVLHEAGWADGGSTRWSGERLFPHDVYEAEPELFTAEHVFPWMLEQHGTLEGLAEAAQLLAEREWPRLYDADVLASNDVPVAAAIYANDLYVPRDLSEETARTIRGLQPWLTSEYEHNGLRADGERVLGRLIDMVKGRV